MLDNKDKLQLDSLGISESELDAQINNFKEGFPFVKLVKPATSGDSILVLDKKKQKYYENYYNTNISNFTVSKFVPASGAASRMFKDLFTFKENFTEQSDFNKFVEENSLQSLDKFFTYIDKFAFYKSLLKRIKAGGINLSELSEQQQKITLVEFLLEEKGLNYANKPKGLLAFHFYFSRYRTAVSEHLVEGARYAVGANREVKIHFTISKEHKQWFEEMVDSKVKKYESEFNVRYTITYSYQLESTNTVAVTPDNKPFRLDNGKILFRPAGHGALIENLNNIKDDIVFIKNIDNVVPDNLKATTIKYKRILGGLLIQIGESIRNHYSRIITKDYTVDTINYIEKVFKENLFIILPEKYYKLDLEGKAMYIKDILVKPVRVCGMVKNEGEPGGGPFIVENDKGEQSLQIVEGAQIDMNNAEQREIVNSATHFNPVDIVCNFTDWTGKSLDIKNNIDANTGFISEKSKDGRVLKAQERPGLWNGAMSDWITIFVEVPIITFNPVKSVNDLLRPEHQSVAALNRLQ